MKDIVVSVEDYVYYKVGFAIIHGSTGEIYIVGAGNSFKNGLSDDLSCIDIWKINRKNENTGVER